MCIQLKKNPFDMQLLFFTFTVFTIYRDYFFAHEVHRESNGFAQNLIIEDTGLLKNQ